MFSTQILVSNGNEGNQHFLETMVDSGAGTEKVEENPSLFVVLRKDENMPEGLRSQLQTTSSA